MVKTLADIEQFENRDTDGNQHLPGWGLDALKFLIEERGVKSIGHETFDTDASVDTAKMAILLENVIYLDKIPSNLNS